MIVRSRQQAAGWPSTPRLFLRTPSGDVLDTINACTLPRRLKGLLGCRFLGPNEACLLHPCNAVHMLGMRFAIDVAWLDASGRVLAVHEAVPPGPHVRLLLCAHAALEVAAGRARPLGLVPGSRIEPIAPSENHPCGSW